MQELFLRKEIMSLLERCPLFKAQEMQNEAENVTLVSTCSLEF